MRPVAAEAVALPASAEQVMKFTAFARDDLIPLVARAESVGSELIRTSMLRTTELTASNLGALERLPLEIVFDIISLLDIRSVFELRHVNHRAEQIVAKSSGYEVSVKYAIETLHVMLKTKAASFVTLSSFAELLCTKNCYLCGHFGSFLFLPTFKRCCFRCIDMGHLPRLRKISKTHLKRRNPWTDAGCPDILKSVVKVLPGHYWDGLHAFTREMRSHVVLCEANPYVHFSHGSQARLRHMVTTSFPWLDIEADHVQTGISCEGCYTSKTALRLPISPPTPWSTKRPVYSEDEFIQHYKNCPLAQQTWDRKFPERMRDQLIRFKAIRREIDERQRKRREEENEQRLNAGIRQLVSQFTAFVNLQIHGRAPQ
ncbi:hypothetical protein N7454_007185 [Penicillium verhagenii]|nr:hypothetical protein N7454_007185 [Penicillium verhagenii]